MTREMHLPDLEIQMRGVLLRINAAQALLQPLPSDCSFSLTVHTKQPLTPQSEQEAKVRYNKRCLPSANMT